MSPNEDSSQPLSRDVVEDFVEQKSRILEENPDLNEEEVKAAVLNDFIGLLGWEIPRDGRMEYQFGEHNRNVVDYAFFLEGSSKLFIEAKSPGTPLENHRGQITEYLALDSVDLGVLTDGRTYEIYRTHIDEEGTVARQQVASLKLDEFPDKLSILQSLTKEEVTSGSYRDHFQHVVDLREARNALGTHRSDLAADIVNLVTDTIGPIAQESAREYVSEYLDNIERGLGSATSSGESTDSNPEADPEPTDEVPYEMVDDVVINTVRDEPVFPVTDLQNISGEDDAKVGVYSCNFDRGLPFVIEHEAWAFIRIDDAPEYFALYLTRPYQQIQIIGHVEDIISKQEFFATHQMERDPDDVDDSKKAILFDELYQLESPIPIGENPHRMRGLRYTTLGELKTARSIDDI